MAHAGLPRRIDRNVSVEQVGDETLVYDEASHKAFCLNRTSSAVWRMCDGAHTAAQIASIATLELAAPISEELVSFSLEELHRDGLLQDLPSSSLPMLSRRELAQKLGVHALLLMPIVAAVLVPKAAQALSGIVTGSEPNLSRSSRARRSFLNQEPAPAPKKDPGDTDSSLP